MNSVTTGEPITTELQDGIVHLTRDERGVATILLGPPSERLVTFTERRLDSLKEVLLRLGEDSGLRGVIVTGPGPGMFAAGADISLIESMSDAAAGERAAAKGQAIFGMFEELPVPVVGAIEGPCLGGGFEMALCFDLRVASDHPATLIGLPEVKLGIVPGFGGTQRLPRLIGIPKALDVILKGKTLKADRARRSGLVDRVVPPAKLHAAAAEELEKLIVRRIKAPRRRLRGAAFWFSRVGVLRRLVRYRVGRTLARGPARFYPAPPRALDLVLEAFGRARPEGLAREAKVLGQLVVSPTCKALVRIYLLTERAKRLGRGENARPVDHAVIIGGGAMGAGIAGLMATKGLRVRLCDLSARALVGAKSRLERSLHKLVQRRSLAPHEARRAQDHLAVATEWGRLDHVDFFLEAVVENLDVKQSLFAQALSSGLGDTAVIASNTSSLPIDEMAAGAPHPERFVGMHFFNPPEKMPLVEVIAGPRSSDASIATTCKLAVRLGKFPVIVKDSPGFLVNRCLAPYLNEAARMMVEGTEPEAIDRVMLDFGLPMGPARLMDEVGFDVAAKVSEVMSAAFPARMQPSALFAAMVDADELGKKSGGGILAPGGRAVLGRLRAMESARKNAYTGSASRSEILERLIYPMVDEAYRCLDAGLVQSEDDLDIGLVMGMGFPPFTGGITRYARDEGLSRIVDRLTVLAAEFDQRFAPSDGLRRRVSE